MTRTAHAGLVAEGLRLGYDDRVVIDGLDLAIPDGAITAIVGPNACGKSTLLRGLARLLPLTGGRVRLDGEDVRRLSPRAFARRVAILPQRSTAPDGIRVADLVARGRHPHQGWFGRHDSEDERIVTEALAATATSDLAERRMEELSGGQQQRVWVAMVLAQQTDVVLLDEPTTYLDVRHQVDLLDLLVERNRTHGTTIVMVLHELNLAARYADHLVVLRDGALVAAGAPTDVLTEAVVQHAFDLPSAVVGDPVTGTPLVVPVGRFDQRPAIATG